MENIASILFAALLTLLTVRVLCLPAKWAVKTCVRGLSGFACLWLVNSAACFTGLALPMNAVTVLLTGTLGIPGIAVAALLEVL
jgi:inhibitor of the pro-sigma K processing machinery